MTKCTVAVSGTRDLTCLLLQQKVNRDAEASQGTARRPRVGGTTHTLSSSSRSPSELGEAAPNGGGETEPRVLADVCVTCEGPRRGSTQDRVSPETGVSGTVVSRTSGMKTFGKTP